MCQHVQDHHFHGLNGLIVEIISLNILSAYLKCLFSCWYNLPYMTPADLTHPYHLYEYLYDLEVHLIVSSRTNTSLYALSGFRKCASIKWWVIIINIFEKMIDQILTLMHSKNEYLEITKDRCDKNGHFHRKKHMRFVALVSINKNCQ